MLDKGLGYWIADILTYRWVSCPVGNALGWLWDVHEEATPIVFVGEEEHTHFDRQFAGQRTSDEHHSLKETLLVRFSEA